MQVLLVYDRNDPQCRNIHSELVTFLNDLEIESYHRISDLITRFIALASWKMILVCIASHKNMLREMEAFREKYPDSRLILALPDQDSETLHIAHELSPSFITYLDDGSADIESVLTKMLQSSSGV